MNQDPTDKLSNDCKLEIRARYGECTTRVPVDQAPAGPALDAAVAVALGKQVKWKDDVVIREPWPIYLAGMTSSRYYNSWKEEEDWREVPKYSTDIAAAWELAEGLALDYEFYIANYKSERTRGWCANYREYHKEWSSVDADTAPLAITRAYLKAKGVEWVEVPD